jgi:hypothetical protein
MGQRATSAHIDNLHVPHAELTALGKRAYWKCRGFDTRKGGCNDFDSD